jgi:predicted metal-dependent hydrolase
MINSTKRIKSQITISASYNDSITITVTDKAASTSFLQMVMTREQWINATMNRLAQTDVESTMIHDLERVGKKMELDTLVVRIAKYGDSRSAIANAQKECPEGWLPDLTFQSQTSFFSEGEEPEKHFARTIIRRWV